MTRGPQRIHWSSAADYQILVRTRCGFCAELVRSRPNMTPESSNAEDGWFVQLGFRYSSTLIWDLQLIARSRDLMKPIFRDV